MTARAIVALLLGAGWLAACGDGDTAPIETGPVTWQWQLQGALNTGYDVDLYDIDLFETDASSIADLRGAGRVVICYFSAGSFEDFRPDADAFGEPVLGRPLDGFDDERWLDVRDPTVRSIMLDRLDLAVSKGCDGVEPDNITAHQNDTGFEISSADQLDFNRFLATEAHRRELLVGLKNDLTHIPALVDEFDFAVNEQCFEFDECDAYEPFLDSGKPVFNAEYAAAMVADPEPVCAQARAIGIRTLVLPVDLDDSFRIGCDD